MIFNQEKLSKSVIGVFFTGQKLKAAYIENGVVANVIDKEINNLDTEEHIIKKLVNSIESIFNRSIEGIGIGVPGIVDIKNGIVYKATNVPSWKKVHLKDILENHFGVPVHVNNDANCFALGEKYFGTTKDFEHTAGIILGVGVGVGIIINSKLYSGQNCGAGEFCSIPYRNHDYEYYCSAGYFKEKYGLPFSTLLKRAQKDDKIALAIFELYGTDIGNLIKAIMYALDPQAVVIGGTLSEAYPYFKEAMLRAVDDFSYQNSSENIQILRSDEPNIATYGAAALCLNNQ